MLNLGGERMRRFTDDLHKPSDYVLAAYELTRLLSPEAAAFDNLAFQAEALALALKYKADVITRFHQELAAKTASLARRVVDDTAISFLQWEALDMAARTLYLITGLIFSLEFECKFR